MPLYSDSNYYYSGGSSQLFSPYYPQSSPYSSPKTPSSYTSSYNRQFGGTYTLPSTPARTPTYTSHGFSSRYQPKLTTITETSPLITSSRHNCSLLPLTRIQSPKYKTYSSPGSSTSTGRYIPPRPILINTADIDVSTAHYRKRKEEQLRRRVENSALSPSTLLRRRDSDEKKDQKDEKDQKAEKKESPEKSVEQSYVKTNRSTIKRDRPVIRLSTVRARNKDPPKEFQKPSEKTPEPEEKKSKEENTRWRDRLADDLVFPCSKVEPELPAETPEEKYSIDAAEEKNEEDLDEVVLELDPRDHSIRRLSIPQCPTFHDFCEDISSDKIDDDLNAGELRRRASIIHEQEEELLNELQKSASGSFQLIHLERRCSQDSLPDESLNTRQSKRKSKKSKKIRHKITAIVDIENSPVMPVLVEKDENGNKVANHRDNVKSPKFNFNIETVEEHHEIHKIFKLPKKKSIKKISKKSNEPTILPEGFMPSMPKVKTPPKNKVEGAKTFISTAEMIPFDPKAAIEKEQKPEETNRKESSNDGPTADTNLNSLSKKDIPSPVKTESFFNETSNSTKVASSNDEEGLIDPHLPKIEPFTLKKKEELKSSMSLDLKEEKTSLKSDMKLKKTLSLQNEDLKSPSSPKLPKKIVPQKLKEETSLLSSPTTPADLKLKKSSSLQNEDLKSPSSPKLPKKIVPQKLKEETSSHPVATIKSSEEKAPELADLKLKKSSSLPNQELQSPSTPKLPRKVIAEKLKEETSLPSSPTSPADFKLKKSFSLQNEDLKSPSSPKLPKKIIAEKLKEETSLPSSPTSPADFKLKKSFSLQNEDLKSPSSPKLPKKIIAEKLKEETSLPSSPTSPADFKLKKSSSLQNEDLKSPSSPKLPKKIVAEKLKEETSSHPTAPTNSSENKTSLPSDLKLKKSSSLPNEDLKSPLSRKLPKKISPKKPKDFKESITPSSTSLSSTALTSPSSSLSPPFSFAEKSEEKVATPKPIRKFIQRSDSGEDFWSQIDSRETLYMTNRKKSWIENQWQKYDEDSMENQTFGEQRINELEATKGVTKEIKSNEKENTLDSLVGESLRKDELLESIKDKEKSLSPKKISKGKVKDGEIGVKSPIKKVLEKVDKTEKKSSPVKKLKSPLKARKSDEGKPTKSKEKETKNLKDFSQMLDKNESLLENNKEIEQQMTQSTLALGNSTSTITKSLIFREETKVSSGETKIKTSPNLRKIGQKAKSPEQQLNENEKENGKAISTTKTTNENITKNAKLINNMADNSLTNLATLDAASITKTISNTNTNATNTGTKQKQTETKSLKVTEVTCSDDRLATSSTSAKSTSATVMTTATEIPTVATKERKVSPTVSANATAINADHFITSAPAKSLITTSPTKGKAANSSASETISTSAITTTSKTTSAIVETKGKTKTKALLSEVETKTDALLSSTTTSTNDKTIITTTSKEVSSGNQTLAKTAVAVDTPSKASSLLTSSSTEKPNKIQNKDSTANEIASTGIAKTVSTPIPAAAPPLPPAKSSISNSSQQPPLLSSSSPPSPSLKNNLTKFATVSNLAQCLQDVDADLDDYLPSSAENSSDDNYSDSDTDSSFDYSIYGYFKISESMKKKLKQRHKKEKQAEKAARFDPQKKVKIDTSNKCYVKDEKPRFPMVATPRPLWKRENIEYSDEDTEDSDSDEGGGSTEDTTDDSEECSSEEYEDDLRSGAKGHPNPVSKVKSAIIRMSTSSNDSGFEGGTAPSSPKKMLECDVNCHKKCEQLTANLCGVNQKLIVEALAHVKRGARDNRDSPSTPPSSNPAFKIEHTDEQEDETSHTYSEFQKSGRFTPPATVIPRFKNYCVDDFHFLAVLGKGSFGKVLLAELRDTTYYYAVKCLKKDVVLEDDDVDSTLIERKVLALGTKHPYLCHLFCTFQTESHLFFVMEYLNGGDLMFHIQESGCFEEKRARFYGAEIISGLKFLHKKGIIYRDLKLDNVLLDYEGHVRIADFGMCKLQIYLDKTADSFCGTPDYMAPEIIKGEKYNQNVDWWSFGVLLYEMLIGKSPFSGCDEDELFYSICNEIPWFPGFISEEATSILKGLLEKDYTKRIGSYYSPAGDVVDHVFFRAIDWNLLEKRQIEPPFKPQVKHPLDTQYFDRVFTRERVRLTPIDKEILQSMDQKQFLGFTYTNPHITLD